MAERAGTWVVDVLPRLNGTTAALEGLARALARAENLPVALQQLCHQAVQGVPGAGMASLTLSRDGVPSTAAATDDHARELDDVQYSTGEGPCLTCLATGRVVCAGDGDTRERWPRFADAGQATGVTSHLSAPFVVDKWLHGSLNLHGPHHGGFTAVDVALLEVFTTAAEAAVYGLRRYHEIRDEVAQLNQVLADTKVVERATGFLMATCGKDAQDAAAMLAERARREHVSAREVSRRLLTDPGTVGLTAENCR